MIKVIKKDLQTQSDYKTKVSLAFDKLLLNDYHTFLTKKIERLTSALYVITGFLRHDEPVRNRLRTCALDLVEESSSPASLSKEGVELFRARCSEIGTLLQTARSAGLISDMNANLLREEYANIATFVKENAQEIQGSTGESTEATSDSSIGHNKVQKRQTDSFFYNGPQNNKGQNKTRPSKGHNERKKIIIELLNKKDNISIRDAVSLIDGVSEKTIQRELLSLVEEGIAIKEGERRWSTYRRAPAPSI